MPKSKKRRQSTDEDHDPDTATEQQSPTKRLRSEKKEQADDTKTPSPQKERKSKASQSKTTSTGDTTPSPTKEGKSKHLKGDSSNSESESTLQSPSKRKGSKRRQFRTPEKPPTSSPLTTPKTPRAASKLGIPADAAKTLLKYASKLNPLVNMIYMVTQYDAEKKEDMRTREDFLSMLIDCVKSLVRYFPIFFRRLLLGYYLTRQKVVFSINAGGDQLDVGF